MGSVGPFQWWMANIDLMGLCHVVTIMASGIVIFSKSARGSSVVVALLTSVLFTSLGVPYFSINQSWQWTSLALLSAGIGFGCLTLAMTAMKVSEVIQSRLVTAAAQGPMGNLPPVGGDQGPEGHNGPSGSGD